MRTSIELPDPVYREIKIRAANEGTTIREIILEGVAMRLREREPDGNTEGRAAVSRDSLQESRFAEAGRGGRLRVHSFSLT